MIKYILLLFCTVSFAQTINKATYSVQLNPPTKSSNTKDNLANTLIINAKPIKYDLFFNKDIAIFKKPKSLKNEAKKEVNLTNILAGGSKTYYTTTSKETNSFYTFKEDNETFLVVYTPIQWKLKNETKKIGDFVCYKAIGSNVSINKINTITAWFSPEIPFSFGPKNYNGLPGLIIEVENSFGVFKLTKLVLESKEKINLKKPKGTIITEKEYYDRMSIMFFDK